MQTSTKVALSVGVLLLLAAMAVLVGFSYLNSPPAGQQLETLQRIQVKNGALVATVAEQLAQAKIIRSPLFSGWLHDWLIWVGA